MAAAGKFREQAVFQHKPAVAVAGDSEGLDELGNPAGKIWQDYATVWADLREVPGREKLAAGQPAALTRGTLRVRSSEITRSIGLGDRVNVRGNFWAVESDPVFVTARGDVLEIIIERGGSFS